MGFGNLKKAIGGVINAIPGGKDLADLHPLSESAVDSANRAKSLGLAPDATREEITTATLFRNLSPEQQKDLLLNNPNIVTPGGSQNYNPLTNTISLTESDFQKDQRLRQEKLAEQLSGSLGGYLPSSNEEIQNATFERGKALLDPVYQSQRRQLEQQLADRGVPKGSEQYNLELNRLEQSQNRAYTDLSQASIQTAEMQRQQRFNEIASLLGNAQLGGQSFQQYQPQFSGLDLFGAEQAGINRSFQQSLLSQQLKQQNKNAIYGALGNLGGSAISAATLFSDERLKENIELTANEKGFNIYEFNYKGDSKRYRGVIAQEVKNIMPDAVVEIDGYLAVNYDKIGLQMTEVFNGN